MAKKVDTKELVQKIAKLARERMMAGPVVELQSVKNASVAAKAPPTLLIIEDDEQVRKSFLRMFASEGYRVLAARDGIELSDVLYDVAIDLIMLDVGLPWINGYELASMMKAHPDLRTVPLIFISGHNDQEAVKRGFQVGAHDYITKPFEIETVRKTVNTLLRLNGVI